MASSVDLWLHSKDSRIPLEIELRPVANGQPDATTPIPLSEVTVNSDDVVANSVGPDINNYTRFKFTSPIRLMPGEYAINIKTNSENYKVWSARLGRKNLDSQGNTIESTHTKQPYVGIVHQPGNAGGKFVSPEDNIMFRVNRNTYNVNQNLERDFKGISDSAKNAY